VNSIVGIMRVGRHNERANAAAAGVTVKRTRHTQYCELSNLTGAHSFDGEPTLRRRNCLMGVRVACDENGRKTIFERRNSGPECAKRNRQLIRRVIYHLTFILYYFFSRFSTARPQANLTYLLQQITVTHIYNIITDDRRFFGFFFFLSLRASGAQTRARLRKARTILLLKNIYLFSFFVVR